jgi:predicted GIY-YIG superfamily endonuclease
MPGGWVYIMTNRPNGILYTGVTSDIGRRANEHHEGLVKGFTKCYGLKRLVYMEFYEYRRGGDPARVEHETLAARLEGTADCELQSRLAGLV